ncbi:6997_t:CDS:10, partial [Scutellospora calospora]
AEDITEVSLYGGRTADYCKEVSLLITPSFQRMYYVATQLLNNRPKSTLEHRLRHRVKCRNTTKISPQMRSDLKPEDFYEKFNYSHKSRNIAEKKLQELLTSIAKERNSFNRRKAKYLLDSFESWINSTSCELYWLNVEASLGRLTHEVMGRISAYKTIKNFTRKINVKEGALNEFPSKRIKNNKPEQQIYPPETSGKARHPLPTNQDHGNESDDENIRRQRSYSPLHVEFVKEMHEADETEDYLSDSDSDYVYSSESSSCASSDNNDTVTLSTGKIVEDALYNFGIKCRHEQKKSSGIVVLDSYLEFYRQRIWEYRWNGSHESSSLASLNRKNRNRTVSAIVSMKRKIMGRRGDLIIRKRYKDPEDDERYVLFSVCSCWDGREQDKKITINWIYTCGLDSPAGYTCRVLRTKMLEISSQITQFGSKVLPVIILTWKAKMIVRDMIEFVEKKQYMEDKENLGNQLQNLQNSCESSPPRKKIDQVTASDSPSSKNQAQKTKTKRNFKNSLLDTTDIFNH